MAVQLPPSRPPKPYDPKTAEQPRYTPDQIVSRDRVTIGGSPLEKIVYESGIVHWVNPDTGELYAAASPWEEDTPTVLKGAATLGVDPLRFLKQPDLRDPGYLWALLVGERGLPQTDQEKREFWQDYFRIQRVAHGGPSVIIPGSGGIRPNQMGGIVPMGTFTFGMGHRQPSYTINVTMPSYSPPPTQQTTQYTAPEPRPAQPTTQAAPQIDVSSIASQVVSQLLSTLGRYLPSGPYPPFGPPPIYVMPPVWAAPYRDIPPPPTWGQQPTSQPASNQPSQKQPFQIVSPKYGTPITV